jgi:hypothetical protein
LITEINQEDDNEDSIQCPDIPMHASLPIKIKNRDFLDGDEPTSRKPSFEYVKFADSNASILVTEIRPSVPFRFLKSVCKGLEAE